MEWEKLMDGLWRAKGVRDRIKYRIKLEEHDIIDRGKLWWFTINLEVMTSDEQTIIEGNFEPKRYGTFEEMKIMSETFIESIGSSI